MQTMENTLEAITIKLKTLNEYPQSMENSKNV